MLLKTRGIVFKTTDYSESSVVLHVFTEQLGMQAYLVNGVKKPSAKIKRNILQPLHLLDMVVYHKPTGNLQRAAEIRHSPVFQTLPYQVVKSSIVLFLNEVLYRAVKQPSPDEPLFQYLFYAIELLDRLEEGLANFHLVFLIKLSRFLGFQPGKVVENTAVFDLKNSQYLDHLPDHPHVLQEPSTTYWRALSAANFENLSTLAIPPAERKYMLYKILEYYRLHLDNFGEIRSVAVLEEVFS